MGWMIVVDAANVVGSRPDGWWRNRAKAAMELCHALAGAVQTGRLRTPVIVVLEGAARAGASELEHGSVQVVHARGSGDDTIVSVATDAATTGHTVTVVTADRELRGRARQAGCDVTGPRWLLDQL